MPRWTIEEATDLTFDGVVALKVMLMSGHISVLGTDDAPSVQVGDVTGQPLLISHEAGMLNITHENLWEGLLKWFGPQRGSADLTVMVPWECPVQLNLVNAGAVITGLTAGVSVKSGAGDITFDGVTGHITANTVSGGIESQGLDGAVSFTSVSGDLALAGGSIDRLAARTVSGRVTADVDLTGSGQVQVNTVSGEVALRLPGSTSAQVSLNTVGGRIDSSFTELDPVVRSVPRSVTGTLGDGAGRLSVATVSGDVTLLSRPGNGAAPSARHRGEPNVEV
jgi:putative adhesin